MVECDNELIRLIEEFSMKAWSSRHTQLEDGWVLRYADGYTRRANSVCPLYPSKNDPQENIKACERIYREQGCGPFSK